MRGARMNLPIKLKKKRTEIKRMRPRLALKGSGAGHSLSATEESKKTSLCFVKPLGLNDGKATRAAYRREQSQKPVRPSGRPSTFLRILREVRRRARLIDAFPGGNSSLTLVKARIRHIAGIRWGSRRYRTMNLLIERETE